MTALIATLATVVAVQYVLIGVYVVPRLAGMADAHSALLTAATWGAAAFFVGCAVTHVGIAVHTFEEGTAGLGSHAAAHALPHVAQVFGGATFIVIAARHLDIRLAPKHVTARLREIEARFRAAFDEAPIGMALVSLDPRSYGRFLQVNPALCAMLGYDAAELRARTFQEVTNPTDLPTATEQVKALVDGTTSSTGAEQRYRHSEGHDVWVSVRANAVRDDAGTPMYSVAQIRDITEERNYQERLRHLADHDPLTGLINRRRFGQELERTVAHTRRYGEPAALLTIDLDHFNIVNDAYGHAVGDEMLIRVAATLSHRLRETDLVGRLGGDEFGVLLPHTDHEQARRTAGALLQAIRDQVTTASDDRIVHVTASIGITLIDRTETSAPEELLIHADMAMYEAKDAGRDRYAAAREPGAARGRVRDRQAWSERIRDALEHDYFELWEQPIIDLRTGQTARSEMLIRMRDPDGGPPITPGTFLYIAERYGQITAIDRWVIAHSIQLLAARHAKHEAQPIEVNLSGRSITDEALIDFIASTISEHDVDPTHLIFEITETAAIGNIDRARGFASRLADLGCQFALDDFGSGFGSFYYLKHMPFDCVKIDGDFIKDLPTSHTDQLTVQAIVQIANGLGKTTIAEYVTDQPTVELLRRYGIHYAQGYHLGTPEPAITPS